MDQQNNIQWAYLELMGRFQTAGIVSEVELFGTKMGRIDIPQEDGSFITQYFGGQAVYRCTPTTEKIARALAKANQPDPVHPWTMRHLMLRSPSTAIRGQDDNDHDDNDHKLSPKQKTKLPESPPGASSARVGRPCSPPGLIFPMCRLGNQIQRPSKLHGPLRKKPKHQVHD